MYNMPAYWPADSLNMPADIWEIIMSYLNSDEALQIYQFLINMDIGGIYSSTKIKSRVYKNKKNDYLIKIGEYDIVTERVLAGGDITGVNRIWTLISPETRAEIKDYYRKKISTASAEISKLGFSEIAGNYKKAALEELKKYPNTKVKVQLPKFDIIYKEIINNHLFIQGDTLINNYVLVKLMVENSLPLHHGLIYKIISANHNVDVWKLFDPYLTLPIYKYIKSKKLINVYQHRNKRLMEYIKEYIKDWTNKKELLKTDNKHMNNIFDYIFR